MSKSDHLPLAFGRIAALTANTFTELTRLKTFYVILLFALLLIGNSAFMARLTFQQEFGVLKDIALGAISLFSSLLAVLATAGLLPRDIEDRTIYTILSKPVSRLEYLLGKLAGVILLLALSIIIMSIVFLIVLKFRELTLLRETSRRLNFSAPPQQIAEASRDISDSGINLNLCGAIAIIFVKAVLLASLTLLISTLASSSIFTTSIMVLTYFVGHLQSIAREYWLEGDSPNLMSNIFLGFITLFFPDLQSFNLVDDISAGVTIPIALIVNTAALGFCYTTFYLLLATAIFCRKEL